MTKEDEQKAEELCCGLVMPISSIDGCNEQHWLDVKEILTEAVEGAGFKVSLVSHADDVGVIQKRIIQNLYENPIVVCDISGKSPNVMFELGMRLAFDKPTIIVKDDKTSHSFDISSIEQLEYPRDLRFTKIVKFKEALKEKAKATLKKSDEDPDYTTFLKHFGTFTVAKLDTKELPKGDYIIEELKDLKKILQRQEAVQRQERMYNERMHMLESAKYGKHPSDKTYMEMRRAIKQVISRDFPDYPASERKSPEMMEMVFRQIIDNEKIQRYFAGPKEIATVFHNVYRDLVA